MPTLQELGIDRWSVAERLALVEQIRDSIPPRAQPPATLAEALAAIAPENLHAEALAGPLVGGEKW